MRHTCAGDATTDQAPRSPRRQQQQQQAARNDQYEAVSTKDGDADAAPGQSYDSSFQGFVLSPHKLARDRVQRLQLQQHQQSQHQDRPQERDRAHASGSLIGSGGLSPRRAHA